MLKEGRGGEGRKEGRARGLFCGFLPSGHFSSYGVLVIWISDISISIGHFFLFKFWLVINPKIITIIKAKGTIFKISSICLAKYRLRKMNFS